jgi:ATP-binding cassette subfamily F protein 3
MISINKLSYFLGDRALYDTMSWHIKPNDKIGLIGANGAGKSTLLRIINGEYLPDEGSISKAKDCKIGFLNQDLLSYDSEKPILEVVLEAFEEENAIMHQINVILHKLETAYTDKLVEQLSKKQEQFEALGGYGLQTRGEEILEGLGFTTAQLQLPLKEFSGGWRMRVMLAKILLAKPSLLMLDEPTNHLDLPSIEWLEKYVQSYDGSVILVSHDQEFLNNCVTTIAEISFSDVQLYPGDYDNFLSQKELRKEIQEASFKNQQKKIKETEEFIARFKAKASKAKQVQSRVKGLERLTRIEAPEEDLSNINIRFRPASPSGKVVLELKNFSKSYGAVDIFKAAEATILRGDKIALIGANGKGKTTLLNIISDEESYDGEKEEGHNVEKTIFAQHQLESLNIENEVIEELATESSESTDTELRNVLGSFLFRGDDIFKKIKVLSGGERSRVALAKTLISEANFLLLDEPTNHLDMKSVNTLIEALENYDGTFLVISHNRKFLHSVANKIWYIEDQKVKEYPGTYQEFEDWYAKNNGPIEGGKAPKKEKKKKEKKVRQPSEEKQFQHQLNKLKQELDKIEKKIESEEQAKKAIEAELALPSVYSNPSALKEQSDKLNVVNKSLEALHEKWEELAMSIDEKEAF